MKFVEGKLETLDENGVGTETVQIVVCEDCNELGSFIVFKPSGELRPECFNLPHLKCDCGSTYCLHGQSFLP